MLFRLQMLNILSNLCEHCLKKNGPLIHTKHDIYPTVQKMKKESFHFSFTVVTLLKAFFFRLFAGLERTRKGKRSLIQYFSFSQILF